MMKWLVPDRVCEMSQYETIERPVSHSSWGVLVEQSVPLPRPSLRSMSTWARATLHPAMDFVTVWVAGICTLNEII
jgi:hypothetical protein